MGHKADRIALSCFRSLPFSLLFLPSLQQRPSQPEPAPTPITRPLLEVFTLSINIGFFFLCALSVYVFVCVCVRQSSSCIVNLGCQAEMNKQEKIKRAGEERKKRGQYRRKMGLKLTAMRRRITSDAQCYTATSCRWLRLLADAFRGRAV